MLEYSNTEGFFPVLSLVSWVISLHSIFPPRKADSKRTRAQITLQTFVTTDIEPIRCLNLTCFCVIGPMCPMCLRWHWYSSFTHRCYQGRLGQFQLQQSHRYSVLSDVLRVFLAIFRTLKHHDLMLLFEHQHLDCLYYLRSKAHKSTHVFLTLLQPFVQQTGNRNLAQSILDQLFKY